MSDDKDDVKRTTIHTQAVPSLLDMQIQNLNRPQDKSAPLLTFDCPVTDMQLCIKIAARAVNEIHLINKARPHLPPLMLDPQKVCMDVATLHCNGTPMRLLALLMSDSSDFQHDVGGIGLHLDRTTGKLFNGFKPLFSEMKQ